MREARAGSMAGPAAGNRVGAAVGALRVLGGASLAVIGEGGGGGVAMLGQPWWRLAGCTAKGAASSRLKKFMRAGAQIGWDERWRCGWSHVCCPGCLHRPVLGVGQTSPTPRNGFQMWVPAVWWHKTWPRPTPPTHI